MKLTTLAAIAAALVIAGCGGDDEPDSPASTTPPATAPAAGTPTVPAESTPAETTPAEQTGERADADDDGIPDLATHKGDLGDALTLLGQPGYKKQATEKVKVTVRAVKGPFSGFNIAKNHKLIGLSVRFYNAGDKPFSDPLPNGKLTATGGASGKQTNLIAVGKPSPCKNPRVNLKPGQSKDVCIAFDIPKSAKPVSFEYKASSGYGDTGIWQLG